MKRTILGKILLKWWFPGAFSKVWKTRALFFPRLGKTSTFVFQGLENETAPSFRRIEDDAVPDAGGPP